MPRRPQQTEEPVGPVGVTLAGVVLLASAFLGPEFKEIWRVNKVDFVLAFVTFILVLALDLLPALIVGVALSVAYIAYRASFPGREVLGRIPETGDFVVTRWLYGRRQGEANPSAAPVPGVIVYRFSAPLFFDGQRGSSSTEIKDARGILNWFKDHG